KLESHHACRAFHHHASLRLSANPGTVRRDRLAERLYMLGYTPHEIADVLAGLIPMYALQRARRMQALGYSHTDIEHYLSRHSAAPVPAADNTTAGNIPATPQHTSAASPRTSERQRIEQFILHNARRYRVDASLIRAVISHESSWRTDARSHAGAVGLMQLMPATARMLGVDPSDPEQNIEGGVRYLAGLLEMFDGDTEAALVAYNAGPTHARKWRRGETALYGETRTYLQRVMESHSRYTS
ncbi:MAG: lytic transglycosylase domain-containing protein, partial [Pseudomonadota bacterium]